MLCGEAWRVPEEGSIDLVVAGTLRNEMLLVATTLLLKSLRTEASIKNKNNKKSVNIRHSTFNTQKFLFYFRHSAFLISAGWCFIIAPVDDQSDRPKCLTIHDLLQHHH